MATLADIRAGIAANLGTLTGCQVSAYLLANPTPPALEVFPDAAEGTEYHQAMGDGLHLWNLSVRGMVATNEGVGAQKLLDAWLADSGADSVFAALESDLTLGGAAEDLMVTGHTGYQEYVHAGLQIPVLAVVWSVQVAATGT